MSRTDRIAQTVPFEPARVWAALVDPDALLGWLPPAGARGRFEHVDLRPGGRYRLVLTFAAPGPGGAKSSADEDVVDVRIIEIVPGERLVQAVDFVSDDPAFGGTMTMTWSLSQAPGGTRVEFRADDVPPGISAEDHRTGMASSLAQLGTWVAGRDGAPRRPPER